METEQETVLTEEKPSFMQRMKKKWINLGLGTIVAGGLLTGSAQNTRAQTAQQEKYNEPPPQTEVFDTQRVKNDTFIAYVYEGDNDWRKDLDFVAEDLQKVNRDGQPLRIQVHEDYDWTNADVINEVRKRINNPEQYPWIEMRGKFWPASPYSRDDGMLNLEQIITKDQSGNEEIFFTDPANSNFYYLDDNYHFDWAFYPGRHMTGFYYPHFRASFAPYWDWDMDGIPNWMDPNPFRWDPWDAWMCDPWHHHGWGWHNNWWAGSHYWNYWGDGDNHWRHNREHDNDFGKVAHIINKKQLQDPNNRSIVNNHIRSVVDSRDLKKILNSDQLRSLGQVRKERNDKNYDLVRKNPNLTIRNKDGKEERMKIQLPENRPGYRITLPDRMREPERKINSDPVNSERNIRRYEPRIQPRTQEPRTGTVVKKDEPKKEQKKEDPQVIKKKDDERSYSLSPRSEYNIRESSANTQRTIFSFPSRLSSDDITSRLRESRETNPGQRLIRPNPSEVNKYSSPRVNYNEIRSNSSRSYSSPSRSTRSYTQPSISRSSPSRSSGSYRSSSSNYSRSSSSRSSSSPSSSSVRRKN